MKIKVGRRATLGVLQVVAMFAIGCTSNAPKQQLTLVGAGSTFVYPFFSRAFYEYSRSHPDVAVNYQSIGSGGGIQQFTKKTVDFGATDVPMSAKELAAVEGGAGSVLQLPVTLGGVVIAYHNVDAPAHLRLTPQLLANIFLGKVTNWSDPAIAVANPGAQFKALPIVVVHRADGSGTTYLFTSYLSAVSPQWKQIAGVGKTVAWPAAASVGAKGNEGVAGQVRNSEGAIGYIELAYALQTHITFAVLQNKAGGFVDPSVDSVAAAAAQKPQVSANDFLIVNQPGARSYPIAGYTWALLYRHYAGAEKQRALGDLFLWLLSEGQSLAAGIDYVALPESVSHAGIRALQRQK